MTKINGHWRVAEKFWKKTHKCYYVQVTDSTGNRDYRRLDPDEDKAEVQRAAIITSLGGSVDDDKPTAPVDMTVRGLIDEFLVHCKATSADATYKWYFGFLNRFAATVPKTMKVRDFQSRHVLAWLNRDYPRVGKKKRSDNTRHDAITCIKRVFNWAVDEMKYFDRNPLRELKKPPRTPRETYLMPEEFEKLLAKVKDQAFRDILIALRHTGCRPQEARNVEVKHFRPSEKSWLLPKELSKGGKRERRVRLNSVMMAICERRAAANPEGPLFRTHRGNKGWTARGLRSRFYRLAKKLGFRATAYTIRHTFATDCILKKIPLPTIALMMGHVDMKMLLYIYQHVQARMDHVEAALEEATAGLPS